MDFDKGSDHLTKEQRVYLKKKLAPEGSFFMKGKYPKTVRTPPVVIDVRGAPPKASGYQRLSEKEQEVVNQYVENLVAADVVERVLDNGQVQSFLFRRRTVHLGLLQTYAKSTSAWSQTAMLCRTLRHS